MARFGSMYPISSGMMITIPCIAFAARDAVQVRSIGALFIVMIRLPIEQYLVQSTMYSTVWM